MPSIWINSSVLWFFYKAVTTRPGIPEDHKCPFTANSVGHENYPFFFGFILWVWLYPLLAVMYKKKSTSDGWHPIRISMLSHSEPPAGKRALQASIMNLYALWLSYHPYAECQVLGPGQCPKTRRSLFHLSCAFYVVVSLFFSLICYLLVSGQTMKDFLGEGDEGPYQRRGEKNWLNGQAIVIPIHHSRIE